MIDWPSPWYSPDTFTMGNVTSILLCTWVSLSEVYYQETDCWVKRFACLIVLHTVIFCAEWHFQLHISLSCTQNSHVFSSFLGFPRLDWLIFAHLLDIKWHLIVAWICIFSDDYGVDFLSYLLDIQIYSFEMSHLPFSLYIYFHFPIFIDDWQRFLVQLQVTSCWL